MIYIHYYESKKYDANYIIWVYRFKLWDENDIYDIKITLIDLTFYVIAQTYDLPMCGRNLLPLYTTLFCQVTYDFWDR